MTQIVYLFVICFTTSDSLLNLYLYLHLKNLKIYKNFLLHRSTGWYS